MKIIIALLMAISLIACGGAQFELKSQSGTSQKAENDLGNGDNACRSEPGSDSDSESDDDSVSDDDSMSDDIGASDDNSNSDDDDSSDDDDCVGDTCNTACQTAQ